MRENETNPDHNTVSALSNLQDGEICTIVLKTGETRDAAWSMLNRCWIFCDGKGDGFAPLSGVEEWWRASVWF